jgi:hypothetical protein
MQYTEVLIGLLIGFASCDIFQGISFCKILSSRLRFSFSLSLSLFRLSFNGTDNKKKEIKFILSKFQLNICIIHLEQGNSIEGAVLRVLLYCDRFLSIQQSPPVRFTVVFFFRTCSRRTKTRSTEEGKKTLSSVEHKRYIQNTYIRPPTLLVNGLKI